jgi:CubicO group peptidase (beta-lactamase class C family)
MDELTAIVDRVAADEEFSGVVRVDRGDDTLVASAFGMADRAHGIANTLDTRFGVASGAKGFTALVVVSLAVDGVLPLDTPVRTVLGDDLPLIADDVTVEHLLTHRSGIGDYLDEDAGGDISDYALTVAPHVLVHSEDYLQVLDGFPTKFAAGTDFAYCNGGFVVLAIVAERVSGVPYHQLVRERVCQPAGMAGTDFFRNDDLPGDVALGYVPLDGRWRTNVYHLPVLGCGDGGITSSVADMRAFWPALYAGRIVPVGWVDRMTTVVSDPPQYSRCYGTGFWLGRGNDRVMLEGYDAGVSFRTTHSPSTGITHTVISNTSEGAWPMIRALDAHLFPA